MVVRDGGRTPRRLQRRGSGAQRIVLRLTSISFFSSVLDDCAPNASPPIALGVRKPMLSSVFSVPFLSAAEVNRFFIATANPAKAAPAIGVTSSLLGGLMGPCEEAPPPAFELLASSASRFVFLDCSATRAGKSSSRKTCLTGSKLGGRSGP